MITRTGLLRRTARDETTAVPSPTVQEPVMWQKLNLKLMSSAGAITALVAILEAGRKWN